MHLRRSSFLLWNALTDVHSTVYLSMCDPHTILQSAKSGPTALVPKCVRYLSLAYPELFSILLILWFVLPKWATLHTLIHTFDFLLDPTGEKSEEVACAQGNYSWMLHNPFWFPYTLTTFLYTGPLLNSPWINLSMPSISSLNLFIPIELVIVISWLNIRY